jgi:branched-subunit amino acid aminotransferase/4-amino-4-deoxychorismate lyase
MPAVVSYQQGKAKGVHDVLYVAKDGRILEGTTWNFFAVIKNKVYTPEEDILYGITRLHVLKVCDHAKIEVQLGNLTINQIPEFDEAFATSTTKEVMPVVKIDGTIIGSGTPGPVTQILMQMFKSIQ